MALSCRDQAVKNHSEGSSCSGAILTAFAAQTGLSESEARRIASPMAGGAMTKCGAVLAAEYVLEHKAELLKREPGELISIFENRFMDMNSSITCRELRGGLGRPKLRSCRGCVEDSADILEAMLKESITK